jgi:hypothetical protein
VIVAPLLFAFTLTLPAFGGIKATIEAPTRRDCEDARRAVKMQLLQNGVTHSLSGCSPVLGPAVPK